LQGWRVRDDRSAVLPLTSADCLQREGVEGQDLRRHLVTISEEAWEATRCGGGDAAGNNLCWSVSEWSVRDKLKHASTVPSSGSNSVSRHARTSQSSSPPTPSPPLSGTPCDPSRMCMVCAKNLEVLRAAGRLELRAESSEGDAGKRRGARCTHSGAMRDVW